MFYIFVFITIFVSELVYFRIADKFNIIDKPNERSSHSQLTLRGGGIVFYTGISIFFLLNNFQYPWFFIGLSLITLISFADDVRPQSSKLRLLIHFTAMGLMFYEWGLYDFPWYFTIIALIFCTGVLNAYNFMDGINGITGGYSLVVAGCLLFINQNIINFINTEFIYLLIIALLVFNFFNFRLKAKCFAGDVGSVSMAFILIFIIGKLIINTGNLGYIILLSVYGVDSVLTIIHRIILKENIFDAHRKHAYQLLANELKIPHLIVSLFYAFLQLIIALGFYAFIDYPYYYLSATIILLAVAYVIFKLKYFHLHKNV
jgi:UDP-N-acetylmuramyl pentapeptide phosphotransferase/UDP-N-acetylglucosamine-1-phosphate transferase